MPKIIMKRESGLLVVGNADPPKQDKKPARRWKLPDGYSGPPVVDGELVPDGVEFVETCMGWQGDYDPNWRWPA